MSMNMMRGAGLAAAFLFLSLPGCGGSGIEEGIPQDTTPAMDPNLMKANMTSRTAPPGQEKTDTAKTSAPSAAPK